MISLHKFIHALSLTDIMINVSVNEILTSESQFIPQSIQLNSTYLSKRLVALTSPT